MIKHIILYVLLCTLGTATYHQTPEFLGAWLETPLKWTKPPAVFQLNEHVAEAAVLYFGSDHHFVVVYGTVIRHPQSEGLSRGDGRVVHLGTWKQEGTKLYVEYRLASRTVQKEGETLPGPTQTDEIVIKDGTLLFQKMRFRPELLLNGDLQDVDKGERARLSP
jgi:hypothetical protein